MTAQVTWLDNRAAITQRLQDQSVRFEQAVAALRAVSDLAGMVSAAHGVGFKGCYELDANALAGLAATLALGIEGSLRDFDATIAEIERFEPNRHHRAEPEATATPPIRPQGLKPA